MSWDLIRLREKKGMNCGKVFHDDRALSNCVSFFTDGKQIAVQILPVPEKFGKDDIILQIRTWNVLARSIEPPCELVIDKNSSADFLKKKIMDDFRSILTAQIADIIIDEEQEHDHIEIAKCCSFGPPISIKVLKVLICHLNSLSFIFF